MKEISKKYGFITATAMIVGICIGSGIFFKSDNILIATGGSILWGIVLFVVSAISIVFGCLTFGELASQTDQVGGLLSYSEEFLGSKAGCGYGWFQILVYYPSITAVVSWVYLYSVWSARNTGASTFDWLCLFMHLLYL